MSPNPDKYFYPAPNTAGDGSPINRNGELWRVPTVDVTGPSYDDAIPQTGGRYYFEFTRPAMLHNTARKLHAVQFSLSEAAIYTGEDTRRVSQVGIVEKRAIQAKIRAGDGASDATNHFSSASARFVAQGVAVGDTLRMDNAAYTQRYRVTAVAGHTLTVTPNFGGGGGLPINMTGIDYHVYRANALGECVVDPYYEGGATGYHCNSNSFWTLKGPLDASTANIVVKFPSWTVGAATLNGTTGVRPDPWDGLQAGVKTQLQWTPTILIYNTSTSGWGIGKVFDWNNSDFLKTDLSTEQAATDAGMCLRAQ